VFANNKACFAIRPNGSLFKNSNVFEPETIWDDILPAVKNVFIDTVNTNNYIVLYSDNKLVLKDLSNNIINFPNFGQCDSLSIKDGILIAVVNKRLHYSKKKTSDIIKAVDWVEYKNFSDVSKIGPCYTKSYYLTTNGDVYYISDITNKDATSKKITTPGVISDITNDSKGNLWMIDLNGDIWYKKSDEGSSVKLILKDTSGYKSISANNIGDLTIVDKTTGSVTLIEHTDNSSIIFIIIAIALFLLFFLFTKKKKK
jgi:LPXTG-motif cell wall-anchored protein